MSIEFTCKECQTELRLDEKDANQKVRCPHCGMIQTSPNWQVGGPLDGKGEQKTVYSDQETAYLGTPQVIEQPDVATAVKEWLLKTPDEKIYGPVTRKTLEEWTDQGRVSPSCFIKQQDGIQWQRAEAVMPQVTELKSINHRTPSSISTPPPPPPRIGAERIIGRRETRPNRGFWILICALVGFFSLNQVLSLIAIVWGLIELKAISEGSVEKKQMAMIVWAIILGAIEITVTSTGSLSLLGR